MVGIPVGTNCAPLLADLFLYSYENEFSDQLINPLRAADFSAHLSQATEEFSQNN